MKETVDTEHKLIFLKPIEFKKRSPDIGKFFNSMPAGALFALVVVGYTLFVGLGVFIGYKKFVAGVVEPESPTGTQVGAILGLLAFMLGFAFSATWTRFINRNAHVVTHAATIRTCYLRTSLIPDKQKLETRRLLREYTTVILAIPITPQKSLNRMDELHLLLWQQTASLVHEEVDSELRSLFTASVNELINLALQRKAITLFVKIPDAIWGSLLILAVVGMIAFGYQAGINGVRNLFQLTLLPFAFGLVIVLIADLNSLQRQRHFKVTQRPLREVVDMMNAFDPITVE